MPDILTEAQRHYNMSRIRGRHTKPEMAVRRGLHGRGLRFRLHRKDLPGKPDLVFPKHRAVIFVHGCFWHGHECPMFKWPETRQEFWRAKISTTQKRDQSILASLRDQRWRVLIVWECALKGPRRQSLDEVLQRCEEFTHCPTHDQLTICGVPQKLLADRVESVGEPRVSLAAP